MLTYLLLLLPQLNTIERQEARRSTKVIDCDIDFVEFDIATFQFQ